MNMKTSDALSKTLGIENEKVETPKQEIMVSPAVYETSPEEDQNEDYALSRRTFRDLINKGNSAIEDLTDLAKESESPRAYEVLATLMKTVSDATKDLYDLQKKTKELKKFDDKGKPTENITVEKAVFVGTTTELLKQMKDARKNE